MKQKKGGELICMRPDSIVEARFNLTRRQNDILDMVFASIENDDNLEYEINLHKYAELYNLKDKSSIYSEVKKAVKSFEGKGFAIVRKISDTKEDRDYFPWFARIKYRDGEGKITVELGKTLKGILLEVKRAIYYKIEYTLNLNSIYSKRIYYYLKLYEDKGTRIDNVDELRDKLECPKGYKNFADFNRYVLKPAYEEINGNSDLTYEYEPIKEGRKITKVKFSIKSNIKPIDEVCATKDGNSTFESEKPPIELIRGIKAIFKNIVDYDLSDKSANEVLKCAIKHKEYGDNPIELIKEVAEYSKTQNIDRNFIGWFKNTVLNYEKPKKAFSKDTFSHYEQRTYDFDDLEKKLLGWDSASN